MKRTFVLAVSMAMVLAITGGGIIVTENMTEHGSLQSFTAIPWEFGTVITFGCIHLSSTSGDFNNS